MDLGLKGKRAAVQGSSMGLGFAVAEALMQEGAKVALCSTSQERGEEAVKRLPGSVFFQIDLDQPGGGKEFVERASRAMGGVDILVTNTGGPPKGDFADLSMQDWEAGYRRLWQSAVESIHAALPGMKQRQFGRVLLLTSTAAKEPIPHLTISSAFRSGLLGLMKSISREVARYHITVNALLPGYTHTKRLEDFGISLERLAEQIPAGRLAEPKEMGALAAFLASMPAAYITGQAIACDGGLIAGL